MRSKDQSTSPSGRTPSRPSRPTPPNAFSSEFLADARERDEALTASEAELSGPWKLEPLPDRPGSVAVVRESESVEEGDVPEAVFRDEEGAVLCAAALPLFEREPLFYLGETPEPDGDLPGGYPVISTHGDQGPQVRGWLRLQPAAGSGAPCRGGAEPRARGPRRGARRRWGWGAGASRAGAGGAAQGALIGEWLTPALRPVAGRRTSECSPPFRADARA